MGLLDKIKAEGQGADNREVTAQDLSSSRSVSTPDGKSVSSGAAHSDEGFDAQNPEKRAGIAEGFLAPDATEAKREVPDSELDTRPVTEEGARSEPSPSDTTAARQNSKSDEEDRQRTLFDHDGYIGLP